MQKLYSNIKRYRKKLNMSQQELAEAVGYKGKSMIAQVENGRVDLPASMITKFAEVFQCSENDLIGDENKTVSGHTPPTALVAFPPEYDFEDNLNEESREFARLFQDASEEDRALVMGFLRKKQPNS